MTNNLRRKLLRDLRQNFIQFLAIFVMCFLAMFMLEGFDSDIAGTGHSVDRYYKETNFMDLSMSCEGFTREDLITVRSVRAVEGAELRYTTVGRIRTGGAEKKLEYNFIESNDISSMLLMEGEPYVSGSNGIWIDRNFARRQGIRVGDELQLICDGVEFNETVQGIVDNPDHLYFMIDDSYSEPDYGEYGFAFLDSKEFPGQTLSFDRMFVDVKGVDNQFYLTEEDKEAIDKARRDIVNVLSKTALTFTPKQKEMGHLSVNSDMESDQTMGTVFPAVFMLIALLGIVTTMTRLVMKQRTLIGTLKALGFPGHVIMLHYVSYAVVVAALGGILGAVAGWSTLGKTMHDAMKIYYSNPYERMELSENVIITIVIITALAGLTNYFACRKLLIQRASDILRPEPPAVIGAGVLEKTPVWGRLSFASRWNLRDINRNKLRTMAALIGVLLCAALLVTAFGANELFKSTDHWEYYELSPAGYTVGFSGETGYETVYDYAKKYSGQMVQQLEAEVSGGGRSQLYYVFIADEGNLYNFQNADGEYIKLPKYGIAMSTRAAEFFGAGIDDIISFKVPGTNTEISGRIKALYKTPGVQGISLSRDFFEAQGGEFKPSLLYTNMTVPESYVRDRAEIVSVFSKEQFIKTLLAKRASVDSTVTYTMTIAVIVGIVVMYNLGELSFIEKTREIATLKVLGFPTAKIRWILQQQNILITGLGTLAGMVVGKRLLVFMMAQLDSEADYIFSKMSIFPYVLAFLLSFVLSLAVNGIISSKVKDINMVEALKGVE